MGAQLKAVVALDVGGRNMDEVLPVEKARLSTRRTSISQAIVGWNGGLIETGTRWIPDADWQARNGEYGPGNLRRLGVASTAADQHHHFDAIVSTSTRWACSARNELH